MKGSPQNAEVSWILMSSSAPITIKGAGLAGCCLAWHCHFRGIPFQLTDTAPQSTSSLVAAGMLSPVTGKAFNPSWRLDDFYTPGMQFYHAVEQEIGLQIWYPYPVVRLFFNASDRKKFEKKRAQQPDLEKWVAATLEHVPHTNAEYGAVVWKASGRLDIRTFITETRAFFTLQGLYHEHTVADTGLVISSTGYKGLTSATPCPLPQRSAKGEILTLKIPTLPQDQIISRGSWIVPTGKEDHTFLAGANYDWDHLNNTPTPEGRLTVEQGVKTLISEPYEVINHTAGVRPIVRRSEPVIGPAPQKPGHYLMNGLGSKGVLYAPVTAHHLIEHLSEGAEIPAFLHLNTVL